MIWSVLNKDIRMTFKFKYKPSSHKNSRISSILPCHMNQFKVYRIMLPYCHVIARSFHNLSSSPPVVTMSWALLVKVSEKLRLHPVSPHPVTPWVSLRLRISALTWGTLSHQLGLGCNPVQTWTWRSALNWAGTKRHKHSGSERVSVQMTGAE